MFVYKIKTHHIRKRLERFERQLAGTNRLFESSAISIRSCHHCRIEYE
jgi:hypothetical protein